MTEDIKQVVIPGKDGKPIIQLEWVKGELYPYHLEMGVGEYNITVRSDGEKTEKIVVVELMLDKRRTVVEGETNKEVGMLNLQDGVKYGVYIGGKDISHRRRPDCVIEGNARHALCPLGCIEVCGGPCPPGYYYKGPCGTCSYSMVLMCCCKA
jgi:hypothetical protein